MHLRMVQYALTRGAICTYAWCFMHLRMVQYALTQGAICTYVWCYMHLRVVLHALTRGAVRFLVCLHLRVVLHRGRAPPPHGQLRVVHETKKKGIWFRHYQHYYHDYHGYLLLSVIVFYLCYYYY